MEWSLLEPYTEKLNPGVLNQDGLQSPTPHYIHVDNNHLAALRRYIRQVLAAAMEAAFCVCGYPHLALRPVAINWEKMEAMVVAYKSILLGFDWNNRRLTVCVVPKILS